MNKKVAIMVAIIFTMPYVVSGSTREFRDEYGNVTSTWETRDRSHTVVRDKYGNTVGTRDRNGNRIQLRDQYGNDSGDEYIEEDR